MQSIHAFPAVHQQSLGKTIRPFCKEITTANTHMQQPVGISKYTKVLHVLIKHVILCNIKWSVHKKHTKYLFLQMINCTPSH
jgi:hypothetical protein